MRWACGADRTEEQCHKDCRAAAAEDQPGRGGIGGGGGCGCIDSVPPVQVCASSGKVYSSHCQLKVRGPSNWNAAANILACWACACSKCGCR